MQVKALLLCVDDEEKLDPFNDCLYVHKHALFDFNSVQSSTVSHSLLVFIKHAWLTLHSIQTLNFYVDISAMLYIDSSFLVKSVCLNAWMTS